MKAETKHIVGHNMEKVADRDQASGHRDVAGMASAKRGFEVEFAQNPDPDQRSWFTLRMTLTNLLARHVEIVADTNGTDGTDTLSVSPLQHTAPRIDLAHRKAFFAMSASMVIVFIEISSSADGIVETPSWPSGPNAG